MVKYNFITHKRENTRVLELLMCCVCFSVVVHGVWCPKWWVLCPIYRVGCLALKASKQVVQVA